MPVYFHGRNAVWQLAKQSDILIAWGAYDLRAMRQWFRGPVVFVGHGSGNFDGNAARLATPGASHYVAVARASVQPFVDCGIPAERVDVIYNGIDPERCKQTVPREETRRKLGIADGEFVVGYLGRMVPEKNPVGIAKAVALLPPRFRAVFVGDGYAMKKQRELIAEVLGKRAVFVDRVEDVGNYLAAFDTFALASPAEGFSMAMLEAMLRDVPCVLTNVGVLPELEEQHGRFWETVKPIHQPQEFADAILRVADMTADQRAARIKRARKIVQTKYLAKQMAARWIAYVNKALATWRPKKCLA